MKTLQEQSCGHVTSEMACPTALAYLKQSQITDYPTVTHTTTMKIIRTVTDPVKFTRQINLPEHIHPRIVSLIVCQSIYHPEYEVW